jgi:hypothetical protein
VATRASICHDASKKTTGEEGDEEGEGGGEGMGEHGGEVEGEELKEVEEVETEEGLGFRRISLASLSSNRAWRKTTATWAAASPWSLKARSQQAPRS